MNKLLAILLVLALTSFTVPASSFAELEMVVVPDADPGPNSKPGSDAAPRSALVNDLFYRLAHACNDPSPSPTATCGPDNIVSNAFSSRIRLFVPTTQAYTIYAIFTDIEGNALIIAPFNQTLTGNTNVTVTFTGVSLPTSSNVATRGLYKFLSIAIGANGIAGFSDYYRFRVGP